MVPRLFRVLLFAYPPALRRDFGGAMSDALTHRWRDCRSLMSKIRVAADLVPDVVASWRSPKAAPQGKVPRNISTDVRDAMRLFRRAPLFTLSAALTLAMGIGASTAIYSLADATLLHPLSIPDPGRVVQAVFSWSYQDFRDVEKQQTAFAAVGAWAHPPIGIEVGGNTIQVDAAAVSGGYFALAGQRAVLGRLLDDSDQTAGSAGAVPSVVISERLWRGALDANAAVLGSTLMINHRPATIVGVVPKSFRGLTLQAAPQVFMPLTSLSNLATGFLSAPGLLNDRGRVWLNWAGRLGGAATLGQADTEARQIYGQAHADTDTKTSADPLPWFSALTGRALGDNPRPRGGARSNPAADLRRLVGILLGATVVTLLLTFATVANLLLVRTEGRLHELAVRIALGAGRRRIARLLAVESLGIGVIGAAAGAGVAALTLQLLSKFALPGQISIENLQLGVNTGILAASATLGVLTAMTFGMSPLWRRNAHDTSAGLRQSGRVTAAQPVRTVLIGLQVALCVLLLGGSLAFGRAVEHALHVDLGFNTADTTIVTINPAVARLGRDRAQAFGEQALARLRADTRVRAAGWAALRPMSGNIMVPPIIEGYVPARGEDTTVQENVVTDGYFEAMGIPIADGRGVSSSDRADSQAVAVVSASMAKRYWPAGNAVGSRISLENRNAGDPKWITVVGIAGDIHRAIGDPAPLILYQPAPQVPGPFGETDYLFVQTAAGSANVVEDVRSVLHAIDPVMPVTAIVPMATHVGVTLMAHRLGLTLFVLFAVVSSLLTGFGLYAVVAAAVAQRTREIGIRVALGAEALTVVKLILRQGLSPVAIGLGAGLAALAASARLIQQFMFSLPVTNAGTLTILVAAIGVLAGVALLLPARRALAVDPTVALRSE